MRYQTQVIPFLEAMITYAKFQGKPLGLILREM
jgi:hypothetical protein